MVLTLRSNAIRSNRKQFVLFFIIGLALLFSNKSYLRDEPHAQSADPFGETDADFEDLELIRLIGSGTISFGFVARLHGKKVVAKIASDHGLYYSDIEIDMLRTLNAPPTIDNIPKLQLAVRSMPNPFRDTKYLEGTLGVPHKNAEKLAKRRRVSVQVMDLLSTRSYAPSTIEEVRLFITSMLSTLSFSHSRNIMHCDLHARNYHFDGEMVSLFDWNAAFLYEKDRVLIHYDDEPKQLMPPEAWDNATAVHATVSAFDVYSVGMLLEKQLEKCCADYADSEEVLLAQALAHLMKTPNPYKRPDTNQLLKHAFLKFT